MAKTSCRAVYEKFKDGTVKDISDELPFKVPTTWQWVRLRDVVVPESGLAYKKEDLAIKSESMVRVLRGGNIQDGNCILKDDDVFIAREKTTGCPTIHAFDYVLPAVTSQIHLGKTAFFHTDYKDVCAGGFLLMLHLIHKDDVFAMYLLLYFQSRTYKDYCKTIANKSGQAFFNLSRQKLVQALVPLPPLAEQKRIVAKVEKLIPLVEEYGRMEETRLQLDADLPATLEKSILQEAIQGKLVPQDPKDESASELLKRIAAERKTLIKTGKLKRDKCESVIFRGSDRLAYETRNGETVCIQDEIPFEIPDSWEWVRLGDMSNYGQCTSVDTADIDPGTWSLDLEEIEKGTGRLIERKTAADKKSKSSKHVFIKGILLYSKLRTYLNKVLVADMDGVCTSEIVPIELNGGVNAEYVRLVLMSPYFLEYTTSRGYGIKMPRVGTEDMKQALIPLPPLNEQRRIVKRVEELKATTRTLVTV